ncbi:MmgE/PrpD family protein [Zavarzinia compransoris]|uniref:MmgE/PrpD family protein n=1 Tax=Zavarzinia compransoris TaxID=1264899 RepID=A0A317E0M3_9PROT|nr:MmgE/PrpD family protein [Zavarzinia compransoris]PWR19994.1 MmgE/PrpD family protein [Zavarzinia compransoris]TDP44890.1 2-methylcitrate dehydratase PrpD [Zavarzinia compransoris]
MTTEKTSLTAGLDALIRAKPITAGDRAAAALFALDALANALAGRQSAPGRILTDWAGAEPRDSAGRAFVYGALTHILEVDDLHRASVVHPGCVVVPAALAVANRIGAGGHAFLDAVLWGFEAACRIGAAVGPAHYRIWHNTATCGPYGAAAAAGRLLGLDGAGMVAALGNAGSQSAGLWQFIETGAMTKHLHAGHAAAAGVNAADLAARGFSGPPHILEGDKGFFRAACPDAVPAAVLADPDGPWALTQTSIKPWPSCRHTHPAIDAALELAPGVNGRAIRAIAVDTYPAALDVCDRPDPQSPYEAKFSLHHCVAAALGDGRVNFDSFEAEARARLAPLRALVTPATGKAYAAAYPRAWGSAVRVTLADGTTLAAARDHALGDPENPLDRAALTEKAKMLLGHARIGPALAGRLIVGLLAFADNGPLPDLSPFVGLA